MQSQRLRVLPGIGQMSFSRSPCLLPGGSRKENSIFQGDSLEKGTLNQ
ncbi:hypothetical protein HAT2_00020 [Candidatus Similichlamydia laticola]|uniref:Uncharacterized protein n=1 Tax=Candidatus Similichlamydia laticola TaxID=2170265 RepID=A0A369KLH0_9BACT|nr:hypothetical protein HAT2_00020 [Candidatus Similichlamydia laticola]